MNTSVSNVVILDLLYDMIMNISMYNVVILDVIIKYELWSYSDSKVWILVSPIKFTRLVWVMLNWASINSSINMNLRQESM